MLLLFFYVWFIIFGVKIFHERKKYMRKPTYNEVYMYKNMFWLAVGLFVFVPVLNNFFLQMIILFTSGDIAYGELSGYVSVVRDVIALIAGYAGLATFIITLVHFGTNALGVIILAFSTHLITFFVSLLTYALYGGDYYYAATFMLVTDMLVNAAVYGLIYLYVILTVKKHETVLNVPEYPSRLICFSHPVSRTLFFGALIFGGAQLLALIYTMIGDFLDPSLGPPVNLNDTMYWVLEYATSIVSILIGYLVMLLIMLLSKKYLKSKFKR